jgi:hypothetical protein
MKENLIVENNIELKAYLFDMIVKEFSEGEPIQDEYDLICMIDDWVQLYDME